MLLTISCNQHIHNVKLHFQVGMAASEKMEDSLRDLADMIESSVSEIESICQTQRKRVFDVSPPPSSCPL